MEPFHSQRLWEIAIAERFVIRQGFPVPMLDAALMPWREGTLRRSSHEASQAKKKALPA